MQTIHRISQLALNTLKFLQGSFRQGYEPALAALVPQQSQFLTPPVPDLKSDGFLWGVPKRRRSVEVRSCRKMGAKNWVWKMLIPKTNLRVCETCGHHYEAKHLCRNCYDKIKKETHAIREAIESKVGTNPEDQSIVVLYANEKDKIDTSAMADKLFIEIPKIRPPWFSSNLLQKTTAKPDAETTTVTVSKPNLG